MNIVSLSQVIRLNQIHWLKLFLSCILLISGILSNLAYYSKKHLKVKMLVN